MIIEAGGGEVVVIKPTLGGLQGDVVMTNKFAKLYNEIMQVHIEGKKERGHEIRLIDPWTKEETNGNVTVHVGDVEETHVVRDIEHALSVVEAENASFGRGMDATGMEENTEKAEHVLRMVGRGATKRGQEIATELAKRGGDR